MLMSPFGNASDLAILSFAVCEYRLTVAQKADRQVHTGGLQISLEKIRHIDVQRCRDVIQI